MLNLDKVVDIQFQDIDWKDYPDFVDSYIINAVYPAVENPISGKSDDWRELTDSELEWLNDQRDFVYEKLMKYLY